MDFSPVGPPSDGLSDVPSFLHLIEIPHQLRGTSSCSRIKHCDIVDEPLGPFVTTIAAMLNASIRRVRTLGRRKSKSARQQLVSPLGPPSEIACLRC